MYSKRAGTSGIRGQLYETKLISLLYFRAFHDNTVQDFHIAANVDNIGSFADICFKAKVDDCDKPVAVFIQTKHRENENQTLKIDWANYFDSYLKIRKSFKESNDSFIFDGTFDETECLFVIYTTARGDLSNDSITSVFSSKLNYLIDTVKIDPKETRVSADTSGTAKQAHRREENVDFLCKIAMKEQVTSLAERLASFLNDEVNFQTMLSNELLQLYHIVLEQQVLEISEIPPYGHRVASFRHNFFDTNEEYLGLFKDTLFKEILKRRTVAPADVKKLLSEFLEDPNDATKLSKLIGTVVTYNNGQLDFDKQLTKECKPQLNQYVSRSTVNEAIELAAKDILMSRHFKVPAAFGNKDLIIWGSDEEINIVIDQLASRIIDLLKTSYSCDYVVIEKSFEDFGFLQPNGGIAGLIGNIFVLDKATKLMTITDNSESLGAHAKRLYKKLSDEVQNLQEYKFCFKIDKLPKLSFDCSDYEENLARDFLKRLLFYTKQADEEGVEKHLKIEIEEYQKDYPNYFQVKTDAIFLKYHDAIQKWWLEPKQATYLTRNSDLFKKAISNIIKDPLMSSINVTFSNKIKQYDYKFTDDAVSSLNLEAHHLSDVIITENSVLTVVKVMQHLKNKDHVVLDLEYIVNLPTNDRNALRAELAESNPAKVLIFVCDRIRNSRNEKRLLQNISNAVQNKKTIVITNDMKSYEMLQKYFPKADNVVYDDKISLNDLSEESQKSILENATVLFQGTEVRLDLILDEKSKAYVKGDVLNQIISEEAFVIGKKIINRNYEEIAHLYVDRRVKKVGGIDVCFKTLNDGNDDIILVTSEPGMGKSTLLTHLSLKTKELYPEIWIVRINLLEYSKEFSKWKEEKTSIDLIKTLELMCRVVLNDKLGNDRNIEIALQDENNVVVLTNCSGDQTTEFQLKLFLNFYDNGKMIFLFDGFDEICPHYTIEVIKCLKTISSSKHRTWITSRSYNEVKMILQREFGPAYEIENFSYMEMQKYLEKYWQYNVRLEELDGTQLDNVRTFIDYMSELEDVKLHGFAIQLHSVYISAALYLLSEIKYKHIPLWTDNTKYDDSIYSKLKDYDDMSSFYEDNRDGNPLHLLLAAVFVETNIKNVSNNSVKWNLEVDGFTFFERFLETKMKTIRFEEKNEMNIYKPDIIITYDKELANFISKHKKLAAYAIFTQQSHKLFSSKDLGEIQDTIRYIAKGEEKTGLIYTETNGVPTFILSEYFAVEYISDCLKNEEDIDTQKSWMEFIFDDMFLIESLINLRNIMDGKLSTDSKLKEILENNKEVIFNLIIEQGRSYIEDIEKMCRLYHVEQNIGKQHWALSEAVAQQLQNFVSFFVEILKCYINKSNLDDFLVTVKKTQLLSAACRYKSDALILLVVDLVRKFDETNLISVLLDNFPLVPRSTIASYAELSSEDIVTRLLVYEDNVASQQASSSSGFSSGPLTASLPSETSTSSQPSRPLSFNLPRRSSTASSSSLVPYPSTNRRRSL